MKQAILITAYTNLTFLKEIIGFFDDDFDFYIHIDKKTKDKNLYLGGKANVRVYSKFRVQWGSEKHLRAIVFLLKEAFKTGGYSYYHLITGSDYPVRPLTDFKSTFCDGNSNNYIEWFELPRASWVMEGGIERVKYFWLGNSLFDIRGKIRKYVYILLKVQRKLGIKRRFISLFPQLYGGGGYWSLSSDAVGYILKTAEEKHLLRYMRHTHCSEEVFMHTILLNAEPAFPVINDSIRYSKWEENASSPKFLEESDIDDIIASKCFFARKFKDSGLIGRINSRNNR